jgi:hypothetical protein
MIVAVRDIAAHCRKCRKTDFGALSGGELRLSTAMACTACGQRTTYRELLEQIGEEAMKRANEAIADLKKNKPKPRK